MRVVGWLVIFAIAAVLFGSVVLAAVGMAKFVTWGGRRLRRRRQGGQVRKRASIRRRAPLASSTRKWR